MKKLSILSLAIILPLLLSSCSMHLGLKKLLGIGAKATPTKVKHVRATHTPPASGAALAATPAATQSLDAILITKSGYQPNPLQVKVGSTVTWINIDTAAHSVTSDTAGIFDSGPISPNASFMYTFNQAGTFTYHSSGDTNVTGSIVVTP